MTITHRPSGSMCIVCKNFRSKTICPNQEAFRKMQTIKKDKCGMIVVKCVEFERGDK